MKLLPLALLPALPALAGPLTPAAPDHRIPTSYESAVMGRRILALSKLADFSTTFPVSTPPADADADASRPRELDGLPINMMDYIADCEDSGNPTVLAVKIATTFRNAAAGSNVSASLRWMPPYPPSRHILPTLWDRLWGAVFGDDGAEGAAAPDTVPYSAANLPRFSLVGHFEPADLSDAPGLTGCFVNKHHDARYWLPGNPIHASYWARLVVEQVYWVGGFGDRAYIGWIPVEEWRAVTREEWEAIRLPGEKKGWKEWSALDGVGETDL